MALTLDSIDIAAKSFWALPLKARDEAFTLLRRETPVFWSRPAESDLLPPEMSQKGFWSLTKFDDIRSASRNPKIFSSAEGISMEDMPKEITAMQSFMAMDAPRHTQLRGIAHQAFSPRNVKRLQDWIHGHARDVVKEMIPKGEADFVKEVSLKLPARIFASFFGLEGDDRLEKTVDAAMKFQAWNDPEVVGEGGPLALMAEVFMTLHQTARELAQERRENPGDDLMTWLVQAEFEGQKMTDEDIIAFFVLLPVAANDTTRHSSAHAVLALSQFPEQRALLVEDVEGRVDTAVEEILRWSSPVLHMRRTLLEDTVVRDVEMKAGDKVVLWYRSGNRDEDAWDRPFEFDITREKIPHLAFGGGGPHFCLGNALARQMLRSLLVEIYTQIPDIEAGEPDFLVANLMNGIKRLPATWTPAGG
jgi:cytochrome P450